VNFFLNFTVEKKNNNDNSSNNNNFNNSEINEIKATMYADDTGGIVRNFESIDYFFKEFNNWGKVSGASMNEDKIAINSSYNSFRNINFAKE
jgi:hypothetical protein